MQILIESQYFPPISTFSLLKEAESICIDIHSYFMKGSYRNRCMITGPNDPVRLSVPLVKGKHQKTPLGEVQISFVEDWKKDHWQSIKSSYGRSPYYSFYDEELQSLFFQNETGLTNWNSALFHWIIDQIGLDLQINYSKEYIDEGEFKDFRDKIRPDTKQSNQKKYEQVFSDRFPFQYDLSILDLLFSKGPEAKNFL